MSRGSAPRPEHRTSRDIISLKCDQTARFIFISSPEIYISCHFLPQWWKKWLNLVLVNGGIIYRSLTPKVVRDGKFVLLLTWIWLPIFSNGRRLMTPCISPQYRSPKEAVLRPLFPPLGRRKDWHTPPSLN